MLFCCSVSQLCPTLCEPMDCSMPGFPVHHQLPELAQTHVYQAGDAIQPFHPLLSPSPPALNLSQHQGLFQWVGFLHQVTKILEFPFTKIIYVLSFLPTSVEQFLRAIWSAVSQAAILIFTQIKLNSQLSHCAFFSSHQYYSKSMLKILGTGIKKSKIN